MSVNARAWLGLTFLAAVMGLLLFASAGTLDYWQGWGYLAVFLGGALLVTLDVMRRDPQLLERRLSAGPTAEKEPVQKVIMLLASAGFIGLLVVPGLDRRFGWSNVPLPATLAGDLLVALGFWATDRVYRENPFTSATIEIAPEQRVISTGPYARVRHPMYASALLYLVGMPPALGSWWGFPVLLVMLPVLLWRLLDEERFLGKNLPGYAEYRAKVRWRLLPRVF